MQSTKELTHAYWLVRCSFKGKAYKQLLADVATTAHAHRIFAGLKKLGATKCTIHFIECTEAEYDILFPEEYQH